MDRNCVEGSNCNCIYVEQNRRCDLCIGDAVRSSISSREEGEKRFVGDCKWDASEYV